MDKILNYDNFLLTSALDTHAQSTLLRPNPKLANALSHSNANGLPPISVLPLAGQYLTILTRLVKAKNVLEIGTLGGYSTICFAEAGAKVTSIEIDPKNRDVAMENCKGLDVEILLGDAQDVMPRLVSEGRQFDLVFVDADFAKEQIIQEFDWAVKLTRPGGAIFLDDVVPSMIHNGDLQKGKEPTSTILTHVGKDERVSATLVPVVVVHDMAPTPVLGGFVLAVVN